MQSRRYTFRRKQKKLSAAAAARLVLASQRSACALWGWPAHGSHACQGRHMPSEHPYGSPAHLLPRSRVAGSAPHMYKGGGASEESGNGRAAGKAESSRAIL
eukprot:366225-Chlamydomonas_euryale.AAC.16